MVGTSSLATRLRQRIELPALLATIPAFYLDVLARHRFVALGLYLVACAATLAVTVADLRAARHRSSAQGRAVQPELGIVLAVSLLLSAVLPGGATADLLAVRLGGAVLLVLRIGETVLPPSWRGGLPRALGLGIGVLGLCGLGFWWLEPRATTFGDGLWLAFTTAATVGYGDIVPSTPAFKILAVFVVLIGFGVLSLVTASIAAMWVRSEERRIEREILADMHREIRAIRDELAALHRSRGAASEPAARRA